MRKLILYGDINDSNNKASSSKSGNNYRGGDTKRISKGNDYKGGVSSFDSQCRVRIKRTFAFNQACDSFGRVGSHEEKDVRNRSKWEIVKNEKRRNR